MMWIGIVALAYLFLGNGFNFGEQNPFNQNQLII